MTAAPVPTMARRPSIVTGKRAFAGTTKMSAVANAATAATVPDGYERAPVSSALPVDQRLGDFLNDEHRDHRCCRACNGSYPVAQNTDEEHKNHSGDEDGHRAESDKVMSPVRTQIGRKKTVTPRVESVGPWTMNENEPSKGRNSQQQNPQSPIRSGLPCERIACESPDATERRSNAWRRARGCQLGSHRHRTD